MDLIFNNIIFYVMILVIFLDIFLGSICALKEKAFNSTFGINGILRKCAMLISSVFLILIDSILKINLLSVVPDDVLHVFSINRIGIFELFGLMFILYESLSVLKNMMKCDIPIPNRLRVFLEKLLNDFTNEMKIDDNE